LNTFAGALDTALIVLFSSCSPNKDIINFVNQASNAIKNLGQPKLFMSLVAGRIVGNNLELAGGGLPPALIYRVDSGRIEEISLKGFPLGVVANHSYKKIPLKINHGDLLLFMTDGFPELFNYKNEMIGMEKIKCALFEVVNEKASAIAEYLNQTFNKWINDTPLKDDLTFLVIKAKNKMLNAIV
jgi:serine phosphatase RsbU (regulator of sigma subunit)